MVTHEAAGRLHRRPHPVPRGRADREGAHQRRPGPGARGDEHAAVVTRVALRGLLGRKLRAALTAFAIVLGVAMVSGTFVLTDTIKSAFSTVFGAVYENTDAVVTGKSAISSDNNGNAQTPPSLPASLLTRVRALPQVGQASASISDTAQLVGRNGKVISSGGAPGLAFSYSPDGQRFNPLTLTSGRFPSGPDEIDIDSSTASKHGYKVGQEIGVVARGPGRALPDRGHRQDRRGFVAWRRHDVHIHVAQGPAAVSQGGAIRPDQRRRPARLHAPGGRHGDQAVARPKRSGQDRSSAGPSGDQGHERLPEHLPGLPACVWWDRPVRGEFRDRQHPVDHCRAAHARVGHAAHARGLPPTGIALGDDRGVRDRNACLGGRPLPRAAAGQGPQLIAGLVRDRPAPGGDCVQDAHDRGRVGGRDRDHDDRRASALASRDARGADLVGARRGPFAAVTVGTVGHPGCRRARFLARWR